MEIDKMSMEWRYAIVFVIVFVICSADKIEVIEETGCADSEFRLTCARLTSLIAILKARLYPSVNNTESETSDSAANCPRMYRAQLQRDLTEWLSDTDDKKGARNIRGPLNNRCSGKNHCSFKLHEDHINSEQWGPGLVQITYACMAETSVSRLCSASLSQTSGFIMSPGYPGYYVGGINCFWTIIPPVGMLVQVSLLDVSLRDITGNEIFCKDSLTVTDHTIGRHLIRTCGEKEEISTVTSQGSQKLTVTFATQSKKIYPRRGFLIYYKVLGCQLPPIPKNVKIYQPPTPNVIQPLLHQSHSINKMPSSHNIPQPYVSRNVVYKYYLRVPYASVKDLQATHVRQKKTFASAPRVKPGIDNKSDGKRERNGIERARERDEARTMSASASASKSLSAAVAHSLAVRARYVCSVGGYVFPDSLLEDRVLACVDGRTWNDTLPSCINKTGNTFDAKFSDIEARAVMANEQSDMFFDFVVPSILIGGLFFGNAIILFIIYRYRRRNSKELVPDSIEAPSSSSMLP